MENIILLNKDALFLPSQNLLISEKGRKKLKKISVIRAYEPLYITVAGKNQFQEEKQILYSMFSRKTFNLFEYINPETMGFLAFLDQEISLQECFKSIERDIEKGYVPFKYGTYLGINLEEVRKFRDY